MKKGFIAGADLHIHNYAAFDDGNNSRLRNCIRALKMMFHLAHTSGFSEVVVAGDLLEKAGHIPGVVAVHLLREMRAIFDTYPGITLLMVTGNHDLYARTDTPGGYSMLEIFPIVFPDRAVLIDNGLYMSPSGVSYVGVPYYQAPEDLYKAVEAARQNFCPGGTEDVVLVVHATVSGFDGIPGTVDASHPCFAPWELVISGDIHRWRECAPNFLMLGNPMHRDRSDVGQQDKGVWRFTQEDGVWVRKLLPIGQKFPQFVPLKTQLDGEGKPIVPEEYASQYVILDIETEAPKAAGTMLPETFDTATGPKQLMLQYLKATGNDGPEILAIAETLITPDVV